MGVVAIVFQIVIGTLVIGYLHPVCIGLVFILGMPLGIAVTRSRSELTYPAMGFLALIVLVPAMRIDIPLSGKVIDRLRVDDMTSALNAAGFIASDWRIATEYSIEENMTAGRSNSSYGQRRIAPLVDSGWTPDRPIEVWVVAESLNSGETLPWHPTQWSTFNAEYVRRAGCRVSGSQLGAKRAATKYNLKSVPNPLIVLKVPSVVQAQLRQYKLLALSCLMASAIWALMIAFVAVVKAVVPQSTLRWLMQQLKPRSFSYRWDRN